MRKGFSAKSVCAVASYAVLAPRAVCAVELTEHAGAAFGVAVLVVVVVVVVICALVYGWCSLPAISLRLSAKAREPSSVSAPAAVQDELSTPTQASIGRGHR